MDPLNVSTSFLKTSHRRSCSQCSTFTILTLRVHKLIYEVNWFHTHRLSKQYQVLFIKSGAINFLPTLY